MAAFPRDTIEPLHGGVLEYILLTRILFIYRCRTSMMSNVFSHPAVYWAARVMAVVVMLGGTWLTMVMLARFFRPSHVVRLVMADLPKLEELSGEFGGLKGRVRFNAQATALGALENRIASLEASRNELWDVMEDHGLALEDLMKERGDAS